MSTVEARLTPSARHERDQAQALNIRGSLAFQGLSLASRLSALVTSLLSLHVTLGLPLVKKLIRPLSLAFELLKLLEFTTLAKVLLTTSPSDEMQASVQACYNATTVTLTCRPATTLLQSPSPAVNSSLSSSSLSPPSSASHWTELTYPPFLPPLPPARRPCLRSWAC